MGSMDLIDYSLPEIVVVIVVVIVGIAIILWCVEASLQQTLVYLAVTVPARFKIKKVFFFPLKIVKSVSFSESGNMLEC